MTILEIEKPTEDRATARWHVEVSDETFTFRGLAFDDPVVTGGQIAERVGAHPVTQFKVMEQVATGEIETKLPNETSDLRGEGRKRFYVIRSDRTFDFTLDGLSFEWPLPAIVGAHLRTLVLAGDDHTLVRVTSGGFEPIHADATVSFDGPDTEEFRLVPRERTVTVRYREQPFELERREWTTEELMVRFAVTAGYKLDLIGGDGGFKELKPGEKIEVRDGMEFTSHVPAGQSS